VCVCGRERAAAVYQFERVALYMPFRVPAGALLQIARKSHVPQSAKRLAYRLTSLASDKHVHSLSLHSGRSFFHLCQEKNTPKRRLAVEPFVEGGDPCKTPIITFFLFLSFAHSSSLHSHASTASTQFSQPKTAP
jgi:hypothetical protein